MSGGTNWNAIGVVTALLGTVLTGAMVFGKLDGRVDQNTKDIAQIQTDRRADNVSLAEIDRRTARIDAKLEILLPTAAVKELQR